MKRKVFVLAILFLLPGIVMAESIWEVQFNNSNPGSGNDCYPSPLAGQTVTVTGVVTAVQQGNYPDFYLQEPDSTTWNGVYVYDTSVDPQVGDRVTVTGQVDEYYGLTELKNLEDYTIHSSGNPLPDTVEIDPSDLMGGCGPGAEAYEGVLAIIFDVDVISDPTQYGEVWITAGGEEDSCIMDDNLWYYGDDQPDPPPSEGDHYDWVVGIVSYSYSEYRLFPRFAADYGVAGGNPPQVSYAYPLSPTELMVEFNEPVEESSAENPANYDIGGLTVTQATRSDTELNKVTLTTSSQTGGNLYTLTVTGVCDLEGNCISEPEIEDFYGGFTPIAMVQQPISEDNDTSRLFGKLVTVTGRVTADTSAFSQSYFYLQDGSYIYYNGVEIFTGGFSPRPAPNLGDSIIVTGFVDEYYGETEVADLKYYREVEGGSEPEPLVVDHDDLADGSPRAERYEGCFVAIDNSVIVEGLDEYYNFKVERAGGSSRVIVRIDSTFAYDPQVGEDLPFARGIQRYTYSQYRLHPRNGSDLTTPVEGDREAALPNRLGITAAYPNPFNARAVIEIEIPAASDVSLEIFDLSGRRVTTLMQERLDPGTYRVTWQARDAASGIYFARLNAQDQSTVRRLVLLK